MAIAYTAAGDLPPWSGFLNRLLGVGGAGGGIAMSSGTLTVTNSTFAGNSANGGATAGGAGGSIASSGGTLTIINSTFAGNSANGTTGSAGGAIAAAGTVTVTNSTFSGNSAAGIGGGIANTGTLTVTNSTFSGNSADVGLGGAIDNYSGTVTVANTILANSTSGGNCAGAVTDGGHNIDDGATCGFTGTGCTATTGNSFCNTNPVLDPAGLQNNGGPTQTVALCTGTGAPSAGCTGASPGINAGDESVCSRIIGIAPVHNLDQRGFIRPGTGAASCSIGAFEANATACVVGTGTGASCTEAALDTCLPGGASFGGTVTFKCGGAATITVTSTKTLSADATIDGGSLITISGGNSVGIFSVNAGVNFTVQNLTIANGNGASNVYGGGGIESSSGPLTVTNSTFSGNSAVAGGGIYSNGPLTVTNSTFSGNSAGTSAGTGGGIAATGPLTVTNSTFSGNSAGWAGGGIAADATLTVTNSTFSGNSASDGFGGGIGVSSSPLTVTNSTFSGNSGGGIFAATGPLTVTNSTFSGNSATDDGGGIRVGYGNTGEPLTVTNSTFSGNSGGISNYSGTVTVTNTVVANSTSGGNCDGSVTDGGHNIADDGSCGFSGTSLSDTNSMLDPVGLANNGGPTQTIALEPGSPAINAGDESVCAAPPVNNLDQRGYVRPGSGATKCSIGAFEANSVARGTCPTVACIAPDQCHMAGTCNTATGNCSASLPQPDGTSCTAGGACSVPDACLGGICVAAQCVSETVGSTGGTVTTGQTTSSTAPVQTTVTSPVAGTVSITQSVGSSSPGYAVLGQQIMISAPNATAGNPLILTFLLDASQIPSTGVGSIQVYKNGDPVQACTNNAQLVAAPDPCVFSQMTLANGDGQITVLTSTASLWTFAVPTEPLVAIPLASVSLRAKTRTQNGTIGVQAVFDASPLGNLDTALSDGFTVAVAGAGLPAAETMRFAFPNCFNLRSVIRCIGTRGEEADFQKQQPAGHTKLKVTAKKRSFAPPLTTEGVTVTLALAGHDLQGEIASCKVERRAQRAECRP